jgi:hypothetical protein
MGAELQGWLELEHENWQRAHLPARLALLDGVRGGDADNFERVYSVAWGGEVVDDQGAGRWLLF